ncbi:dihydroneopterin aldolase [Haloferula luteola]|uniref:dihydroneopterin aldolase n=1 Tax=Haloferula luteola TaxID=595692 RepID=A0A840VAQ8_9BACT|nr:dihydroneopterin aldolase [Haloferula luteola]MBB5351768.1 dihydroneopterin aldolase [Haloferula luteola]
MSNGWIHVRGLEVTTRIGVPDEERATPQLLKVDLSMKPACGFDEMADEVAATLDYHAISLAVADLAGRGERRLVETLADDIAELVLGSFGATTVKVEIRKFILPQTEWVGVSLEKNRR